MMHDQAAEMPVLTFATREAWQVWLEAHHDSSAGVWLRIAKKAAADPTVSYEDALTVALCFGWIDGDLGHRQDLRREHGDGGSDVVGLARRSLRQYPVQPARAGHRTLIGPSLLPCVQAKEVRPSAGPPI